MFVFIFLFYCSPSQSVGDLGMLWRFGFRKNTADQEIIASGEWIMNEPHINCCFPKWLEGLDLSGVSKKTATKLNEAEIRWFLFRSVEGMLSVYVKASILFIGLNWLKFEADNIYEEESVWHNTGNLLLQLLGLVSILISKILNP